MSESLVGRRIIISPEVNSVWYGTWIVVDDWTYDNGKHAVAIVHPIHRSGAFDLNDCELVPLSKLERVMK